MSDELLPCPFCGGEPLEFRVPWFGKLWRIECKNCDAGPSSSLSLDVARKVWNRRAPSTLEAELAKAREALFDNIAMSATPDDIYRHRGPYLNPAGGQQILFTHSIEKARYRYAAEMMKARDSIRALSQDKEAREAAPVDNVNSGDGG